MRSTAESIQSVLALLAPETAERIRAASSLYGGAFQELRLYRNGHAVIVCGNRNIITTAICGEKELESVLLALCGNSLYAHSDTIREGFIFSSNGLRAGVCGRAIVQSGRIERVSDITSLCIRIPSRFPGVYDALLPYIAHDGAIFGMLIWSRPGCGKTTALRELALRLSSGEYAYRCALVDTRYELGAGVSGELLDIYRGYPRAAGMELAIRTMAPQIVICDEIATAEDAEAILNCASSGAAVIASAHAGSAEELLRRSSIRRLVDAGVFPVLAGLTRTAKGVECSIIESGKDMP